VQRLIIWIRVALVVVFLSTAAPVLLLAVGAALALCDFFYAFRRRRPFPPDTAPGTRAVSVVIPNWNGRDLLEKYLPSVIEALAGNPDNEVIVVDNASTDGSAAFLRERFPQVRVLPLERNLGFGGGSNAGFRAARHDIVVLLNSDMRVDPGFLAPLLEGFRDSRVFAVSAQIFFTDPKKVRQETGLTEGLWVNGRLRVRHVIDDRVKTLFPVFYAGGGSSAYDRRKFLELGGFDPLYEPFYLEDTDLGYLAWKRGWTVHYEPRSIVYHEHRGTIGRTYGEAYIQGVLKKNFLLFTWKNVHDWTMLAEHLFQVYGGMWVRLLAGDTPSRTSPPSLIRAVRALGPALRSRARARRLAAIDDREAFRRPLGGYYRDRFDTPDPRRDKLNVLFLSPYPIYPPIHGGAVFMGQTLAELGRLARVHVICLLDWEHERETNQKLERDCASVEFLVRMPHDDHGWSALLPHAARVFSSRDLAWRLHRTIFTEKIDIVQVEYTQLAVYELDFRRVATFLFEHDIYFQSVARLLRGERSPIRWAQAAFEYLRALRFELQAVRRYDGVQICTPENRRYLESFVGEKARLVDGLRAGIDVARYRYVEDGREPDSVLFVGNFRHLPNQEALLYLWQRVWPRVRARRPQAKLYIVGAEAGPGFAEIYTRDGSCFLGQVDDIREPLSRYAVFACPVLSGSGVRVKLLEAFAAGIPAVSTTIGAEGLTRDGLVELADTPEEFAAKVVGLLESPGRTRVMAARARREVEQNWDIKLLTARLEQHYREVLAGKLRREISCR
jgi:GT2 family glycosyltransferase/glycosyltransferase involved in cell wall biosynthesis